MGSSASFDKDATDSVCLGLSQIRIDAHSVTYNSAYYLIIISEIIIIRKVI